MTMNWLESALWTTVCTQLLMSAAHDHRYILGEKPTIYFAWTRTGFSPLMQLVELSRKADAATAKAAERKERAHRARRNPPK